MPKRSSLQYVTPLEPPGELKKRPKIGHFPTLTVGFRVGDTHYSPTETVYQDSTLEQVPSDILAEIPFEDESDEDSNETTVDNSTHVGEDKEDECIDRGLESENTLLQEVLPLHEEEGQLTDEYISTSPGLEVPSSDVSSESETTLGFPSDAESEEELTREEGRPSLSPELNRSYDPSILNEQDTLVQETNADLVSSEFNELESDDEVIPETQDVESPTNGSPTLSAQASYDHPVEPLNLPESRRASIDSDSESGGHSDDSSDVISESEPEISASSSQHESQGSESSDSETDSEGEEVTNAKPHATPYRSDSHGNIGGVTSTPAVFLKKRTASNLAPSPLLHHASPSNMSPSVRTPTHAAVKRTKPLKPRPSPYAKSPISETEHVANSQSEDSDSSENIQSSQAVDVPGNYGVSLKEQVEESENEDSYVEGAHPSSDANTPGDQSQESEAESVAESEICLQRTRASNHSAKLRRHSHEKAAPSKILQGVLDKKVRVDGTFYLVHFRGETEPEWMPLVELEPFQQEIKEYEATTREYLRELSLLETETGFGDDTDSDTEEPVNFVFSILSR
ncbi:hypothetical protein K493DRAFT_362044 [Basidiobolus meristosporus CBS 931.73]|uniref:Chromo domain-containing protein n=1 Tax=Basidiobolus meristosporus CBS 931.73 TaxID=1314790 RepID=A0A1Y1X5J4_9FUNG|nr:hypothetical protein K493DRAFT_362044 [Basidiobolus meristosporus CBS 931.73]|eukprot:ORX80915.1 hypothetical protein K493DRAFT_362044 [Basidiobolus meristosporus CBS 931.73]